MGVFDMMRRRNNYIVNVCVPSVETVMGLDPSDLYRTQPHLQSVISFLADNVAHLPLEVYEMLDERNVKLANGSQLDLLFKQPNQDCTEHELIRDSASDYFLYGWFLWIVIPDKYSKSGWTITHIPTSWIKSNPTYDGLKPCEYTFLNPSTRVSVTVKADDCIRFFNYGPDGPLDPLTPINALKQILSEQVSAWNYRNSVWKNGGRVSGYITRPIDAPDWSQTGARQRFIESWKAKFSGENGTDTGGTPLLEDGMELKTTQFNAREAQWLETTKLSREEVAGAYHVNPSLIWHTDGQTYASAKDNARALYSDTLSPFLDLLEERINAFLIPKITTNENLFVAFNLDAKLQGSFEERAGVIQSAVGGPWMTINEARSKNNLPSVDGGDELIVPLNVEIGGLASPNDTDPTIERYSSEPEIKSQCKKSRGRAEIESSMEIASCLRKFFNRQAKSVIPKIDNSKSRGHNVKSDDDFPEWWNADRWNRELAEDLTPLFLNQAIRQGRKTLRDVGINPDKFNSEIIENYISAMAAGKAKAINNVTYRQLQNALDENISEDAIGSTPSGVFEKAVDDRSDISAKSFATAVAGWAVIEAINQQGDKQATKTWIVTSSNPRAEHAAMNGETVLLDDVFSNGAKWPGDQILTPDESCNCQCEVEITIP